MKGSSHPELVGTGLGTGCLVLVGVPGVRVAVRVRVGTRVFVLVAVGGVPVTVLVAVAGVPSVGTAVGSGGGGSKGVALT